MNGQRATRTSATAAPATSTKRPACATATQAPGIAKRPATKKRP